MPRFSQLFITALAVVGASASAVIDLTPKNFDDIVLKSGKPALVEFFAPWCGHCKNLAPVYEELAKSFEFAKDKVSIAKVDADAEKELGKRFEIQGFPTLKWFSGAAGETKPEDYKGGRDLESLLKFVQDKTGVKPKTAPKPESHVKMLTETNFDKEIGGEKEAIVAFTAPWCGHCKSLAPTWEKTATDFLPESNVLIAKVDCEGPISKPVCERFGVKSYPTIKYFAKGDKTEGVAYSGGRSEQDIVEFMNEKAGTFRSVGGGLNALAGIIPTLDSAVASLRTSGGEQAYNELIKAAGQAKEKYAEYYSKVAKKLQDNAGYVEKELNRLTGLISKGNLSRDKLDDLVTRSNILRKFQGDGEENETETEEKSEL